MILAWASPYNCYGNVFLVFYEAVFSAAYRPGQWWQALPIIKTDTNPNSIIRLKLILSTIFISVTVITLVLPPEQKNEYFSRICILTYMIFPIGRQYIPHMIVITDDYIHTYNTCITSKHETLTQCCSNVGPPYTTLAHHRTNTGSTSRVCWDRHINHIWLVNYCNNTLINTTVEIVVLPD